MSMKVMDGLRTVGGATLELDIPPLSRATGTTVDGPAIDMAGHFELLALAQAGLIGASSSCSVVVQESNEPAANFADVPGSTVILTASNTQKLVDVNWKHPDRKRYARLRMVTAGTSASLAGALTLRLNQCNGDVSKDGALTEVK